MNKYLTSLVVLLVACQEENKSNQSPVINDIEISPDSEVSTSATLTCTTAHSDPDGDSVEVFTEWENVTTGQPLGDGPNLQLNPDLVRPEDTVACKVEVEDEKGESSFAETKIKIVNTQPVIDSVAITAQDSIDNQSELNCEVSASDADNDELVVRYQWQSDGVELGNEQTLDLAKESLNPTDTVECIVEVEDEYGAIQSASEIVAVGNNSPVFEGLSIESDADITANSLLRCVPDVSDTDGDSIEFEYRWLTNGTLIGSGDVLQLSPELVSFGDTVDCEVTASDSSGASVSAVSSISIGNSTPTWIEEATINSAADAVVGAQLSCQASAEDADGDEVSVNYEWHNQGSVIFSGATITLDNQNSIPGDDVECLAIATDPHGAKITSGSSVTVENTDPVFVTAAAIKSNSGYTTDALLECQADAQDANGSVNLAYNWRNITKGVSLSQDATLQLTNGMAAPGDEVQCVVVATDSHGGSVSSISKVVIENSAPQFTIAASIGPATVITIDSALTCEGQATDIDGDIPQLSYEWTNATRGQIMGTGSNISLDASMVSPNEQIACMVTATDAEGQTTVSNATASISNRAPVFTSAAAITPKLDIFNDSKLECEASSLDDDGENATLRYEWKNDTTGESLGDTTDLLLSASLASPGDTISCKVSAEDSYGGIAESTSTVTVENRAPSFSTPALISSVNGHFSDSTLSCTVTANDTDGDSVTYSYEWRNETQETVIGNFFSVTLNSAIVSVNDELSCNVTVTDSSGVAVSTTDTITIQDSSPTFSSAPAITPNSGVKTNSVLSCDASAIDRTGNPVTVSYAWRNLTQGVNLSNAASLDLGTTSVQPNDEVSCVVTATDDQGEVVLDVASVAVENTAPAGLLSSLSPSDPIEGEDVVCVIDTAATDADGQGVSYQFEWVVNEASFSGPFLETTHTGDTLSGDMTVEGDRVECIITATDGIDGLSSSSVVTILGIADPLSELSDEFDAASPLSPWERVYDAELWNVDQLESFDIDTTVSGALTMVPYSSSWSEDYRAPSFFHQVEGDFAVTLQVQVSSRAGAGAPNSVDSLAGLLIRSSRNDSPASWTAGNENHLSLTVGAADMVGTYQIANQNTESSISDISVDSGWSKGELRAVRIDDAFIMMSRRHGGSWEIQKRYQRSDLPQNVQVGLVAYTDWDTISGMDALTFNSSVVTSGNPDLVASFDFIRYQTAALTAANAGIDLLDETAVTDSDLLMMFGTVLD
jgi:hypothetical protein